ncbi:MAG TPA: AprI/Inh family metalloprotease inhibitor [Methylocystis sp.]|nr:AprI/Inh family metalloprotease inhibitor [Methylocystis sp.]
MRLSLVFDTCQSVARRLPSALVISLITSLPAGAALAQSRGDVAGRYAVLRAEDKDTGCMLTLQAGGKAQLAPACRDNGIVIFDPVSWSLDRGRLVLKARKGHNTKFDRDPRGFWRRDAKEGKPLALRPM